MITSVVSCRCSYRSRTTYFPARIHEGGGSTQLPSDAPLCPIFPFFLRRDAIFFPWTPVYVHEGPFVNPFPRFARTAMARRVGCLYFPGAAGEVHHQRRGSDAALRCQGVCLLIRPNRGNRRRQSRHNYLAWLKAAGKEGRERGSFPLISEMKAQESGTTL